MSDFIGNAVITEDYVFNQTFGLTVLKGTSVETAGAPSWDIDLAERTGNGTRYPVRWHTGMNGEWVYTDIPWTKISLIEEAA